ncbi:MAG: recombinase family protein [Elusimicrobiota bacterium]|nr:MAG: recombinase family protein [Elusimicrobiota bacterium]
MFDFFNQRLRFSIFHNNRDGARKRRVDVVLVWRFDRFARSSRHLLNVLEEFRALGVDFVSFQEAIDTTTPAGKMVFAMVAAIAEFERALIRERVLAGLQRARVKGKTLGRPRLTPKEDLGALRATGMSVRAIAERLGLSKSWVAGTLALSRNPGRNPGATSSEVRTRNRRPGISCLMDNGCTLP